MANHYEFFVDDSEISIAELGSGFLKNYLEYRTITKGFIVVTQNRAYLKGQNYEFTSPTKATRTTQERIVELKDITGTGYRQYESTFCKVMTILFSILSFMGFIGFFIYLDNVFSRKFPTESLLFLTPIVAFVIFLIKYLTSRINCFTISYAGGSFGVDTTWCEQSFVDNFHKELRKAIDSAKQTGSSQPAPVSVSVASSVPKAANNKVDKVSVLREYHKLLEDGIISDEEFEKMKAQVIGK
jgi:hypothetical protein